MNKGGADRPMTENMPILQPADIFMLRAKKERLPMSPVLQASNEDSVPVLPVVSPDVLQHDESNEASERQFDETLEYNGIALNDWVLFLSGLFLGFFITLGSSSYISFFSPCM